MPTETAEQFARRREEEEILLAISAPDSKVRAIHLAKATEFRAQLRALKKPRSS